MAQNTIRTTALLPARADLAGPRLRLFEAALELFGERGYDAVSVRDLMSALGQQPGALYGHVPSKQHLLYELTCIGHEEQRDRLKDALLDAGREPNDQIRALTRAHVAIHLQYPALARVTTREARALSEEQRMSVLVVRDESIRMFLDVVERGVRLGAFAPEEPLLAVYAVGALGVRAAEWWTPDSPFSASKVADTYAEYAVRLLGPATPTE
ncbi:MAG: TetR family transcriptional regulator [Frankiales bacterium]|nr:TetR family transcriptional regulator [Frankiales bacterium]